MLLLQCAGGVIAGGGGEGACTHVWPRAERRRGAAGWLRHNIRGETKKSQFEYYEISVRA